jgi:hypothetical protein
MIELSISFFEPFSSNVDVIGAVLNEMVPSQRNAIRDDDLSEFEMRAQRIRIG